VKTFILSLGFFIAAVALTALLYGAIDVPATDAFTMEHARVDHTVPADGRLHWAAEEVMREEEI
jgi:hypothetical protein